MGLTQVERQAKREAKNLSQRVNYIRANPRLTGYTVATLPTGVQGDQAFVTDADTPTYLGALTGSAAVVCPVMHNGTIWISH